MALEIPVDFYSNIKDSVLRERLYELTLDPLAKSHNLEIYDRRGNNLIPRYFDFSTQPQYNITFDTVPTNLYETDTLYFAQSPNISDLEFDTKRDEVPAKFTVPLIVNLQTDKLDAIDFFAVEYLSELNSNVKITDTLEYSKTYIYFDWTDSSDLISPDEKKDQISLFELDNSKLFRSTNTNFDYLPTVKKIEQTYSLSTEASIGNLYKFDLTENSKSFNDRQNSKYNSFNCYIKSEEENEYGRILRCYLVKELNTSFIDEQTGKLIVAENIIEDVLCDFYFYGEIVGNDERLKTYLSNKGWDKFKDLNAYKDYSNDDSIDDSIFRNVKSKELILTGEEIFPYIGSYKALFNVLDHLGWDDLKIEQEYIDLQASTQGALKYLKVNNASLANNSKINQSIQSGLVVPSGGLSLSYPLSVEVLPGTGVSYPSSGPNLNTIQNFGPNSPSQSFVPPPVKSYSQLIADKKELEQKNNTGVNPGKIYSTNPDRSLVVPQSKADIVAKLSSLKDLLQESFLPFNVKITDISAEIVKFNISLLSTWNSNNTIIKVGNGNPPNFFAKPTENDITDLSDFLTRSLDLLGLKYYNLKPSDILSRKSDCYYSLGDISTHPKISSINPNGFKPVYKDSKLTVNGFNFTELYSDGFIVPTLTDPNVKYIVRIKKDGTFQIDVYSEQFLNSSEYPLDLVDSNVIKTFDNFTFYVYFNTVNSTLELRSINIHNVVNTSSNFLNNYSFKILNTAYFCKLSAELLGLKYRNKDANLIPFDPVLPYRWSIKNITGAGGSIVTAREYNEGLAGIDELYLRTVDNTQVYKISINSDGALIPELDVFNPAVPDGILLDNNIIRISNAGYLYTEPYTNQSTAGIINQLIVFNNSSNIENYSVEFNPLINDLAPAIDGSLVTNYVLPNNTDLYYYLIRSIYIDPCTNKSELKIFKLVADNNKFLYTNLVPSSDILYSNYELISEELITPNGYSIKVGFTNGELITTKLQNPIQLPADNYSVGHILLELNVSDNLKIIQQDNSIVPNKFELFYNPSYNNFDSISVLDSTPLTEGLTLLQFDSNNKQCYKLKVDENGSTFFDIELNTTPFQFFWVNSSSITENVNSNIFSDPYAVYFDSLGNLQSEKYGSDFFDSYSYLLNSFNGITYRLCVLDDGSLYTQKECSNFSNLPNQINFLAPDGFTWKLKISDSGNVYTVKDLNVPRKFNVDVTKISQKIAVFNTINYYYNIEILNNGSLNTYGKNYSDSIKKFDSNSLIYPYARVENYNKPVYSYWSNENISEMILPFEPTTLEGSKFFALARIDRAIAWFSLNNSHLPETELPPVIIKIKENNISDTLELVLKNFNENNFSDNYDVYIDYRSDGNDIAIDYSINSHGNIEINTADLPTGINSLTSNFDDFKMNITILQKFLFLNSSNIPVNQLWSSIRSMTPYRFFQHPGYKNSLNIELLDEIILSLFDQLNIKTPEEAGVEFFGLNIITSEFLKVLNYIDSFLNDPDIIGSNTNISNLNTLGFTNFLGSFCLLELDDFPLRIRDLDCKINVMRSDLDANPSPENGALAYFKIKDSRSKYYQPSIRWKIQHSVKDWNYVSEFSDPYTSRKWRGRYVMFVPFAGYYHASLEIQEGNGEHSWRAKWRVLNVSERKADFNAIGIGQFKDLKIKETSPVKKVRDTSFLPHGNLPLISNPIQDMDMKIKSFDRANYMFDNSYYSSRMIDEFSVAAVHDELNTVEFKGTDLYETMQNRQNNLGEAPSTKLTFDHDNLEYKIDNYEIYDISNIDKSKAYLTGSTINTNSVRIDDTIGLREIDSNKNWLVETNWLTGIEKNSRVAYPNTRNSRFFTDNIVYSIPVNLLDANSSYYSRIRYFSKTSGIKSKWFINSPTFNELNTSGYKFVNFNSTSTKKTFNPTLNIIVSADSIYVKIENLNNTISPEYYLYEIYEDSYFDKPINQILTFEKSAIFQDIPPGNTYFLRVGYKLNSNFDNYEYIWSPLQKVNSEDFSDTSLNMGWLTTLDFLYAPGSLFTQKCYAEEFLYSRKFLKDIDGITLFELFADSTGALTTVPVTDTELINSISINAIKIQNYYITLNVNGNIRTTTDVNFLSTSEILDLGNDVLFLNSQFDTNEYYLDEYKEFYHYSNHKVIDCSLNSTRNALTIQFQDRVTISAGNFIPFNFVLKIKNRNNNVIVRTEFSTVKDLAELNSKIVQFFPLNNGLYDIEIYILDSKNNLQFHSPNFIKAQTVINNPTEFYSENIILETDNSSNIVFNTSILPLGEIVSNYYVDLYLDQECKHLLTRKKYNTDSVNIWEITSLLSKSEYLYAKPYIISNNGNIFSYKDEVSFLSLFNSEAERDAELISTSVQNSTINKPLFKVGFSENTTGIPSGTSFKPTLGLFIEPTVSNIQMCYSYDNSFYMNIFDNTNVIFGKFKKISSNQHSTWSNYVEFNKSDIKIYKNSFNNLFSIQYSEDLNGTVINFEKNSIFNSVRIQFSEDYDFIYKSKVVYYTINENTDSVFLPNYFHDNNCLLFFKISFCNEILYPENNGDFQELIIPRIKKENPTVDSMILNISKRDALHSYYDFKFPHLIPDNVQYEIEISDDPYFGNPVLDPFNSTEYNKSFELFSKTPINLAQNQSVYIDNPIKLTERRLEPIYALERLNFYMPLKNDSNNTVFNRNIWEMIIDTDGAFNTNLLLKDSLSIESDEDLFNLEIFCTDEGHLFPIKKFGNPTYSSRPTNQIEKYFEIITDTNGALITVPYLDSLNNNINVIEYIVIEDPENRRWKVNVNRNGNIISTLIPLEEYFLYPVVDYYVPELVWNSNNQYLLIINEVGALITKKSTGENSRRNIIKTKKSYKSIGLRYKFSEQSWKIKVSNSGEIIKEKLENYNSSHSTHLDFSLNEKLNIDYFGNLFIDENISPTDLSIEPIFLFSPNGTKFRIVKDGNDSSTVVKTIQLNPNDYSEYLFDSEIYLNDSGNTKIFGLGVDEELHMNTYELAENSYLPNEWDIFDRFPILQTNKKNVFELTVNSIGTLITKKYSTNTIQNIYIDSDMYITESKGNSKKWYFYIDYDGSIKTNEIKNTNSLIFNSYSPTKYTFFKVPNLESYWEYTLTDSGSVETKNATDTVSKSFLIRNNTLTFWNIEMMGVLSSLESITMIDKNFNYETLIIKNMRIDSVNKIPTECFVEFINDPTYILEDFGINIQEIITYSDGYHVKHSSKSTVEYRLSNFKIVNYPEYAIELDPSYVDLFKINDIIHINFLKFDKSAGVFDTNFNSAFRIIDIQTVIFEETGIVRALRLKVNDNLRLARYGNFELDPYIKPYILNLGENKPYNLTIDSEITRNLIVNKLGESKTETLEPVIIQDSNLEFWKAYVDDIDTSVIITEPTLNDKVNIPIFTSQRNTDYVKITVLGENAEIPRSLVTEYSDTENGKYSTFRDIQSADPNKKFRITLDNNLAIKTSGLPVENNEVIFNPILRADDGNLYRVNCNENGTLQTELIVDTSTLTLEELQQVDNAIYIRVEYPVYYWTLEISTTGVLKVIPYNLKINDNFEYSKNLRLKLVEEKNNNIDNSRIFQIDSRKYSNLLKLYGVFIESDDYYDIDEFFLKPNKFILSAPTSNYRYDYDIEFLKIQEPSNIAKYNGNYIPNSNNLFVQFKNTNNKLFPIDNNAINFYESFPINERQKNFRINNGKIENLKKIRIKDLKYYRIKTLNKLKPSPREFFTVMNVFKNSILYFNKKYKFPIYAEQNNSSLNNIEEQFKNPYKNFVRWNSENPNNQISKIESSKVISILRTLSIRVDYMRELEFEEERFAITFILKHNFASAQRIESIDMGIMLNPINRGVKEFRFKFNKTGDGLLFLNKRGDEVLKYYCSADYTSKNYLIDIINSSIPLLESFYFVKDEIDPTFIKAYSKNVKYFDVRTFLPNTRIELDYDNGKLLLVNIPKGQKIQFGKKEWSSLSVIDSSNLFSVKQSLQEFFAQFKEYFVNISMNTTIDGFECIEIRIKDYDVSDTINNTISEIRGLRLAEIDETYKDYIDTINFIDFNKKNRYQANAVNNAFVINNQVRMDIGSIITFVPDKSTVENVKEYHWRIFNSKTNLLIYRSFSPYMNYMFDESGYYSIELSITDSNGNNYSRRKNDWIIIENSIN
jgi:hypothetical protein